MKLLDQLKGKAAQKEGAALQAARDANAEASRVRALESKLVTLELCVTNAKARITDAELQLQSAKSQVKNIETFILNNAGKTELNAGVPTGTILDGQAFTNLAKFKSAIEFWPKIKSHLEDELAAAELELAKFVSDNGLS